MTGTAKQHVADDYSHILYESMLTSNAEFVKNVADYSDKYAGIKSDSWAMCSQTNSTYVDCPVEPHTTDFFVTSYNPAAVAVGVQTFKVPPSEDYTVQYWNATTSSWNVAESDLLCYDFLENDVDMSSYKDCNLHVKVEA